MPLRELLFGRPLRTEEEQVEQIGPLSGIPVLGLDALASAAYGPEAALTVLLPLGALASGYIGLITLCIVALLLAVFVSYRQTIPAYPQGGGSFTVAKENLGRVPGLLAASALSSCSPAESTLPSARCARSAAIRSSSRVGRAPRS